MISIVDENVSWRFICLRNFITAPESLITGWDAYGRA
jgi:hypothetical protein